jgi:hypothetical protein
MSEEGIGFLAPQTAGKPLSPSPLPRDPECAAEEIRALRQRAGDWLDANGELAEAIRQYLAAGGFDQAADLIEKSYVEILSRGGLEDLKRRACPPRSTAGEGRPARREPCG